MTPLTKAHMLAQAHKQNFDTLRRAFREGQAALLECRLIATGEEVPVIVAVNPEAGEFEFIPFAMMFNTNPYEMLDPPALGSDPNRIAEQSS